MKYVRIVNLNLDKFRMLCSILLVRILLRIVPTIDSLEPYFHEKYDGYVAVTSTIFGSRTSAWGATEDEAYKFLKIEARCCTVKDVVEDISYLSNFMGNSIIMYKLKVYNEKK